MPSADFAAALIDLVGVQFGTDGSVTVSHVPVGWGNDEHITKVIKALNSKVAAAERDSAALQEELATWFDHSMERVSGWYKRKTQLIVLVVATILVIVSNADGLRYAHALSTNATVREAVVAAAGNLAPSDSASTLPDVQQARAELGQLNFALGWTGTDPSDPRTPPAGLGGWFDWDFLLAHVPGWLLTILAVSVGAPFWFDLLGRLVRVRSAGLVPASTSSDAKSEAG
jgi:hypothetical protein